MANRLAGVVWPAVMQIIAASSGATPYSMLLMRWQRVGSRLSVASAAFLAAYVIPLAAGEVAAQQATTPVSPQEVRALGRLEQPGMVAEIGPFLSDTSFAVRAEAANALAQAMWAVPRGERTAADSTVVAAVASQLRTRLKVERDAEVVSAIAQSLGRLPYRGAAELGAAERDLAALLVHQSSAVIALGAARGLESLVRLAGNGYLPSARTLAIARSFARGRGGGGGAGGQAVIHAEDSSAAPGAWQERTQNDSSLAAARRLVLLMLISAHAADSATVESAIGDADPQLRRLAALAGASWKDANARQRVLDRLLHDPASMVRTEAVRAWASTPGADCAPLLNAANDPAPHVAMTAIDAIGGACAARRAGEAGRLLDGLVASGEGASDEARGGAGPPARLAMHRGAHALLSLARVAPTLALRRMQAALVAPAWQTRMYVARAAAVLADTAALESLSGDEHPNVRSEAIAGLTRVVGHRADSIYIGALAATDYQLVLAAAQALRGAPPTPRTPPAESALLAALARISAEKRETSRDPRIAILATLGSIGSPDMAGALTPYLSDFDPVVADSAAAMISRWTGRRERATPRPLPSVHSQSIDSLRSGEIHVLFTMAASAGGGHFELQLFPDDAPATVRRFVRLLRRGYYDGLTMHRVVPDFVVQGGSPGANEYMGDGPFMRDEVGLRSHARGTVGISTRGRDTGDAQFFINLVDNPRLDHQYTVFAEVVSGMATVDQLLEGDVIASVAIVPER